MMSRHYFAQSRVWSKISERFTSLKDMLSLDLRSLAFFRILVGLYLLFDTINRITLVPAFYHDDGILPREVANLNFIEQAYHFQLMLLSGEMLFSYLILGILLLLSLFLIAGYKTRPIIFLSWLIFCNVIIRDGATTNAGDLLIALLLFWGFFMPLGNMFSIDSLQNKHLKYSNKKVFSAATVALYIQFALIYITSGLFKIQYDTWLDGTHIYLTFSRFEFMRPFSFLIYPHYELLSFLTYFTLIVELFGPLLFFIPFYYLFFRYAGIILFLGLQLSIAMTIHIGIFPLASIAGILVFLPSEFWDSPVFENVKGKIQNIKQKITSHKKTAIQPVASEVRGPSLVTNIFLSAVIVYIIFWNVGEVSSDFKLSDEVKLPGYYLKLNQRWAMFSAPASFSEYYTADAIFSDGSEKDLIGHLRVHRDITGGFYHVYFRNFRWTELMTKRIVFDTYPRHRDYFFQYLIRELNDGQSEDKRLERIEFTAHRHQIGEYYDHSPVRPVVLYTYFNDDIAQE